MRQEYSAFYLEMQEEIISGGGYQIERVTIAPGLSGTWVTLPGVSADRVILFFHGGGFTLGSTEDHLGMCIRLARAAKVRVFSVDYRLAPEHVFPAAVDDAVASYRYLIANGFHPHRILPAGISAGGTLVLSLLLSVRDQNLGLPLAGMCFSPMVSMLLEGESVKKNRERDSVTPERLVAVRTAWLAGHDPKDPLASPLFAVMNGLPRIYVQAGTHELLASDIAAFVEKARWAGVPVQADVWEGMFHTWQMYAGQIPEAEEAIERAGRFAGEILKR